MDSELREFGDIIIREEDFAETADVNLDGVHITGELPVRFTNLLPHNPRLRKAWEGGSYRSLSERAYALMYYCGRACLSKNESADVHVALYEKHGRKEDGIRKASSTLRAWQKGWNEAEAWEASMGNGQPGEQENREPEAVKDVATSAIHEHEPLSIFLARDIKSVPSIVGDGLLIEKGLHTMIGPKGKGKTMFITQVGITAAGGLEYLLIPDLLVHRAIPVLYINLEMPEAVFESRLQQQIRQAIDRGFNMERAWPNFRRITLRGKMRLDKKDGRVLLVKLIRETKSKLVIIDNLGAAMAVDSNSDERMAPIFLALYEICESEGVAIILVLHTPKDLGERDEVYWARGSSVQADRADTIMTIKPYGDEEKGFQRRIGFHLRSGPELDPIIITRRKGELIWAAGKQKDVRAKWLRDYNLEFPDATTEEAMKAFGEAGHGGRSTFFATQKLLLKGKS